MGTGLDKRQIYLRKQLYEELGLRTYLITYIKDDNFIYGAFLDELEKNNKYYDTKNNIRIYPIENFKKIGKTQ